MNLSAYLAGLALGALFMATPTLGLAQDQLPSTMNDRESSVMEQGREKFSVDQSAQGEDQLAIIDIAQVAFCYAGSAEDPSTGESVDLYTLCTDDLDIA
jgi:hypothetical protein